MVPTAEIKQCLHCAETQEVDQHFKENIDNCCSASQCSCQLISYDEIKEDYLVCYDLHPLLP